MKLITYLLFCLFLFVYKRNFAQESESIATKTGWSVGGMPILSYDSDLGFKYGVLGNLFHYGDGSRYPCYNHSIYGEFSNSTKGSDTYLLKYDSKYVFNNIRLSSTLGYFKDQFLDFYGFNGYEANYNKDFTDRRSSNYISRAFYKQSRKMFRTTVDLIGEIDGSNFKWVLGSAMFNMKMGSVDVARYNRESTPEDTLPNPETTPGAYERYVKSGLISESEKNGGTLLSLKTGIVYDSRDNEANSMKGVWSELLLVGTNVFKASKPLYLQIVATHRQYFTLIKNRLGLATRIGFQQKIAGSIPYYMLPILYSSNRAPMNGLGGYMNMRGVLRNRLEGEGLCYANFELRWKAFKAMIKQKNNFYAAFTAFTDMGMVTKRYQGGPMGANNLGVLTSNKNETIHQSIGAGLHLAYNHNFIVSLYYGQPLNKQDGQRGLYTDIDFLF